MKTLPEKIRIGQQQRDNMLPGIVQLADTVNGILAYLKEREEWEKTAKTDWVEFKKWQQSKESLEGRCEHEASGIIYQSIPPQVKCVKCGEYYAHDTPSKEKEECPHPKEGWCRDCFPCQKCWDEKEILCTHSKEKEELDVKSLLEAYSDFKSAYNHYFKTGKLEVAKRQEEHMVEIEEIIKTNLK